MGGPGGPEIAPIREALRQSNLQSPIASTRNLSGGCIHRVLEVTLSDGQRVVAKLNEVECKSNFDEEATGLRALAATRTVVVPEPLACIVHENLAVLLMTAIAPPNPATQIGDAWRQFGIDLAALHAVDAGDKYGFESDNHIGSSLQPNHWCDDWVEFNAIHRLGFQVQTASETGLLLSHEVNRLHQLIQGLDRVLPRRPRPALLHGDLWSGNALPASRHTTNGAIATYAVIDPACSVGDGWADIAMMKLFGGFGADCFAEYASRNRDHDEIEQRIAVYQLYHVLNHVNIFGRGYAAQAINLVAKLGF